MYKKMITQINVYKEGDNPIFGESVTEISLDDEGGGVYIRLTQHPDNDQPNTIRLDFDEVDDVVSAIKELENLSQTKNQKAVWPFPTDSPE
jgi:hypothetical protein